jgi:hypothetical protein
VSEARKGAHVGDLLVGSFVILFGLCITLAGGACITLWVTWMIPGGASGGGGALGIFLLLVSLGVAALGIFAIYHGIRIARSRYRDGGAAPASREP